jgi:hypothetical protein
LKDARRKKLTEIVADLAARADEKIKSDEVSEHMKKILESRRADLSELQRLREHQAASELDVRKAQADLAEAEIRLALRKEELRKSQADAGIERFNQQLREVSTDLVQDEMRLAMVLERLSRISTARRMLDEYTGIAEHELPQVNRTLEKARWTRDGLSVSP